MIEIIIEKQNIKKWINDIVRDRYLYLLLLPGLIMLMIFKYAPMYGLSIAFKDYNIFTGINASPWVGMLQFERLFRNPNFVQIISNTFIISTAKLIFGFPAPIILSLLLNEIKNLKFKKFTQTVVYLPHFISWVIFGGIIIDFLSPDGIINELIQIFGYQPINFLIRKDLFRSILVSTNIYKSVGWGTIIYMAAISTIDPALYEAAIIDGATKVQRIWKITLPMIKSVIIILFILNLGNILNAGFEQIFMLYNPVVYETGDILDTYVYRKGIVSTNYSLATAAGLFKSLIALVLIIGTNKIATIFGEDGIW